MEQWSSDVGWERRAYERAPSDIQSHGHRTDRHIYIPWYRRTGDVPHFPLPPEDGR